MKTLGILLSLLAIVSCTQIESKVPNDITDYIEIVKCFLNQENLLQDISSVIDIIKSGEYDKLLSLAFKLYADVSVAMKECIKKEDAVLSSINTFEQNVHTIMPNDDCIAYCESEFPETKRDLCRAMYCME